MSDSISARVRSLAEAWRRRAARWEERAESAGKDSPIGRAFRSEATTYLAGALELDAILLVEEYATTET